MEEAIRIARPAALANLGVKGEGRLLLPERFVDEETWKAVERIDRGLAAGRHVFFEMLDIPDRRYFQEDPRP